MVLSDLIPIFVDTNLDTSIALSIPFDITVGDLKCKLGQEHLSCFANCGEIKVQSLMVKRRLHFYHLPDAMPIKSAFEGLRGIWFIRVHATRLQDIPLPTTCNPSPIPHDIDHSRKSREKQPFVSYDHGVEDCSLSEIITTRGDKDSSLIVSAEQPKFTKKSKRKRTAIELEGNTITNNLDCKSSLTGHPLERKEAPSMNTTENIISVTGIISRYFSDFDEVDSYGKEHKHKLEESHKSEINDSTMRAPEYSVCQTTCENMMESDTDSVCSGNNIIASDTKQLKSAVIKVKRSSKVRKPRKRSKLMVSTPISHKLEVGHKLIHAANNISVSCSGKKSSKMMFISRYGNLSAPESNVARRIAFELDDFDN